MLKRQKLTDAEAEVILVMLTNHFYDQSVGGIGHNAHTMGKAYEKLKEAQMWLKEAK
jgi:hypothetical protein